MLFKTCALFVQHYDMLLDFFKVANCSPELQKIILKTFSTDTARAEYVALACLGIKLTGPWMMLFYTSVDTEINHMEAVKLIEKLVDTLRKIEDPLSLMDGHKDLFGQDLKEGSPFTIIQAFDVDRCLLQTMLRALIDATIEVLEKQYEKYFAMEETVREVLKKEVETARCHNMDAEEIMGMFSAAKRKAPNATLDFLPSRMRGIKNQTARYLDSLPDGVRAEIMKKVVPCARQVRAEKRKESHELLQELFKRQADKRQAKDDSDRRTYQLSLKKGGIKALQSLTTVADPETAEKLLRGKLVGHNICHSWSEDGIVRQYSGSLLSFTKTNGYVVSYWLESEPEEYDVYDVRQYELVVDFILGDLTVG